MSKPIIASSAGERSTLGRRAALRRGALIGLGVWGASLLAACSAPAPSQPAGGATAKPSGGETAAPAQQPAGGSTITMKFGFATVNDMQHEFAKQLKEAVEKQTDKALEVQIFPASQLGDNSRMLEGVQLGTLEANIQPPEFLYAVDPRFVVLSMPYLFDTAEEVSKAVLTPAAKQIISVGEAKGITGMGIFQYGIGGVIGHFPVHSPDDFRGKKIRVLGSKMEIATMSAWGATGVPMALAEVGPALQQKTVDGIVQAPQTYYTLKYQELARYWNQTGHYFVQSVFIVNKRWYDGLPDSIRKVLTDTTDSLQVAMAQWSDAKNKEAVDATRNSGNNEVIIPTKDELAALKAKLVPAVWDQYLSETPTAKPLVDAVQAELKKIRGG